MPLGPITGSTVPRPAAAVSKRRASGRNTRPKCCHRRAANDARDARRDPNPRPCLAVRGACRAPRCRGGCRGRHGCHESRAGRRGRAVGVAGILRRRAGRAARPAPPAAALGAAPDDGLRCRRAAWCPGGRDRDHRGRRVRADRRGARADALARARAADPRGGAQRRPAPLGSVRCARDRDAARRHRRRRRIRQHRPRDRRAAAGIRRTRRRGVAQRPARIRWPTKSSPRTGCSMRSGAATPSCSPCRSTRRRGT